MLWQVFLVATVGGFAFGCGNALAKWIIWRNCHRIQSMTWRRIGGGRHEV